MTPTSHDRDGSPSSTGLDLIEALLARLRRGDSAARDELFDLVYQQLRVIAKASGKGRGRSPTLPTTALVHEAYLKMCGRPDWESRVHFFAVAARAMRSVLVDHARRRGSKKRRPLGTRIDLEALVARYDDRVDVLALNDALTRLERRDPQLAQFIELRFFAGQTVAEAAAAVGLAERTAARSWAAAQTMLLRELGP